MSTTDCYAGGHQAECGDLYRRSLMRVARTQSRASIVVFALTTLTANPAAAQRFDSISPALRELVRVATSRVVLEHVEIIDGTGAAPMRDRNVTIESGKIASISPARCVDALSSRTAR